LRGQQALASRLRQLPGSGNLACEFEASADQCARGAEARGIRMMGIDRSTVASESGVPLRSTGFVVDELTRTDDDLVEKRV
jgi:hypothetical protein